MKLQRVTQHFERVAVTNTCFRKLFLLSPTHGILISNLCCDSLSGPNWQFALMESDVVTNSESVKQTTIKFQTKLSALRKLWN